VTINASCSATDRPWQLPVGNARIRLVLRLMDHDASRFTGRAAEGPGGQAWSRHRDDHLGRGLLGGRRRLAQRPGGDRHSATAVAAITAPTSHVGW
jgi:hypothetical protein